MLIKQGLHDMHFFTVTAGFYRHASQGWRQTRKNPYQSPLALRKYYPCIEWATNTAAHSLQDHDEDCLPTTETQTLEELCINTIRFLSADAVQNANSGHPGMPMGAAAMAYTLWTKFLKFNPKDPGWFDRDRFVLSAGHGSMLLYSLLHLTGYDLPLAELKRFRQWGSKTPGHPERGHTPGVEVATGPLGQGISNAVGLAIGEAWFAD